MAYARVIQKLPPGPDLDLLLIGNSGNGKSATGNSILGRKEFISKGGDKSSTKKHQIGYSKFDGRVLKVVDTPGFGDTEEETEEKQDKLVAKSVCRALRKFPQGITALILVMKYTARFTVQQKIAIESLKNIMGDDAIRLHTVIVFTEADSFYNEHGDDADFESWCKKNGKKMKHILEECQYRCVLFDNLDKDPRRKKSQLFQLVSQVDKLIHLHHRYTFQKFESTCQFEIEEEEIEDIERCSKESGLIKDDLEKINKDSTFDDKTILLQEIHQRVEAVRQKAIGKGKINITLDCLVENVRRYGEAMDKRKRLSVMRSETERQGDIGGKQRRVSDKHKALLEIEEGVQQEERILEELKTTIIENVDETEHCLDGRRKKTIFGKKIVGLFKGSGNKIASLFGFESSYDLK